MNRAIPAIACVLVFVASLSLVLPGCGAAPAADDAGPGAAAAASSDAGSATGAAPSEIPTVNDKLVLSDAEWRRRLTPAQYDVLRGHATEAPFCGGYAAIERNGAGTYYCVGCGAPLFESKAMFTSGTGWPSFFTAIPGRVATSTDNSFGMDRTECHCARCGGHLGHVFDDGPAPTGERYCINAVALRFVPAGKDATASATAAPDATTSGTAP